MDGYVVLGVWISWDGRAVLTVDYTAIWIDVGVGVRRRKYSIWSKLIVDVQCDRNESDTWVEEKNRVRVLYSTWECGRTALSYNI